MRRIFLATACLIIATTSFAYAACGPVTVCNQFQPPPNCHTTTYCSFVPFGNQAAATTPDAKSAGYSIKLNGLSSEQVQDILGRLNVDQSKLGPVK
jgi:hypothetical protein